VPDPSSARYAAFVAHDRRFDGRLFIGVTSTGVYCRPVCRVRTPRLENCRFFDHPAAAEAQGFRPCLRCRPELAPGRALIDMPSQLAWAAAQRIEAGELGDADLGMLAQRLGITDRHLRRVFRDAFGVSPIDYAQTQRLLLAKRLLADTDLPVTEVALAAGFGSLRRFHALFRSRYGLTPTTVRQRRHDRPPGGDGSQRCLLGYRPPFDWAALLDFLALRTVRGIEQVEDGHYRRSLRLTGPDGREHAGWLSLRHAADRHAVEAHISSGLLPVLPAALAAVRRLADLSCDPQAVAATLGPLAADAPGLRVPGAVDGFEMAVRAVLGQQVSVRAAHTLAGRLVAAFGTPVTTPWPGIDRVFPDPARLAQVDAAALAALGLVRRRADTVIALARALVDGTLDLGPSAAIDATLARLQALPGIGPWTAQYIALRALGWPDAWPSGDIALRHALGDLSPFETDRLAEAWRPWRSYATLHLWRRGPTSPTPEHPDDRPDLLD
jgi:AraC family transcriptional regulator of adaptative response / DNA-3-methyladenine glycosylase II